MVVSWRCCGKNISFRWEQGIRTRLVTEAASRDELLELLSDAFSKAGNATLMTNELKDTLVDHSAATTVD